MLIGSQDGELTFIDLISLLSFYIGVENLESNLTQTDRQAMQEDLAEKADRILAEIHAHLEEQDKKIDEIMRLLNEKN